MLTSISSQDYDRFVSRIQKTETCWLWLGSVHKSTGYGQIEIQKKNYLVHRVSYYLHNDYMDQSLKVLHSCDIRICVNPKHLFLGTQMDNINDAMDKDRHCHGESHGMVRLTEKDILDIREMRRSTDMTLQEIADIYFTDKQHISRICKYQSWKHIR